METTFEIDVCQQHLLRTCEGKERLWQVVAIRFVAELSFPGGQIIDLVLRGIVASIELEHV